MSDYLKSRNRNQFVNGLPKKMNRCFIGSWGCSYCLRQLGNLQTLQLSLTLSKPRLTHVEALGTSGERGGNSSWEHLTLQAWKIGESKIYCVWATDIHRYPLHIDYVLFAWRKGDVLVVCYLAENSRVMGMVFQKGAMVHRLNLSTFHVEQIHTNIYHQCLIFFLTKAIADINTVGTCPGNASGFGVMEPFGTPTQKQMAHSNGPEASPSPERFLRRTILRKSLANTL